MSVTSAEKTLDGVVIAVVIWLLLAFWNAGNQLFNYLCACWRKYGRIIKALVWCNKYESTLKEELQILYDGQ